MIYQSPHAVWIALIIPTRLALVQLPMPYQQTRTIMSRQNYSKAVLNYDGEITVERDCADLDERKKTKNTQQSLIMNSFHSGY